MTRNAQYSCLIVLVLAILAGSASAQGGCFRHRAATVNAPMNIRQSHSTASAVVRGALADESFTVSSSTQGRSYCWLQISEGWIAWTTRVSASGPVESTAPLGQQTTPTTAVDNCCFVNRQCQTDKEWVDGYWAYQRNACPVNQPTTQQTIAQPVNGAAAGVDNCCFTGWQCSSDAEWTSGYWAYQNNQCAAGPPRSEGGRTGNIIIEGSRSFQTWVNAGLDLLRQRAPRWYDYVQGATRKLKERPAASGAFVDVDVAEHHTAWDPNIIYPSDLNIFTIAHEMVHEACHIYQYRRGDSFHGVHAEKACLEKEIELFPLIDPQGRYRNRLESWQYTADNMLHDKSLWWW